VTAEHDDDVAALRRVGAVVAEAREAMLASARPGISTAELDAVGAEVLRRHGARSAPRLAYGFPGSCCIGINDRVAHGIPSPTAVLRSGDLVNVDVSAELDGYWADTGASVAVGGVAPQHCRLLEVTMAAQRDAMRVARAGRPLRHVGRAVERRARKAGFSVIAHLAGHGVGRGIHEPPTVWNVEVLRDRTVLHEGLVLAIEPFLTAGAPAIVEDGDGWTLRTVDGAVAAQFEHTVVVTAGEPIVLTAAA
jgi:methionyl aminopeptidase